MKSTAENSALPQPEFTADGWPWNCAPIRRSYASTPPKISVVTPSYNQGCFLEETIRSVLLQGYPNLEYFVIDGGSTDESIEIIRRYAPWLAGWVSEPDGGQSAAINKGFRQATGEIVNWINSDDIMLPGALHEIADAAMAHPKHDLFYGDRFRIDKSGSVIGLNLPPTSLSMRKFAVACWIPQETTFWRASVFDRVGYLDESMQFAMDYEYWLRCFTNGVKFRHVNRFLGAFRDHESCKSNNIQHVLEKERSDLQSRYPGIRLTRIRERFYTFVYHRFYRIRQRLHQRLNPLPSKTLDLAEGNK